MKIVLTIEKCTQLHHMLIAQKSINCNFTFEGSEDFRAEL